MALFRHVRIVPPAPSNKDTGYQKDLDRLIMRSGQVDQSYVSMYSCLFPGLLLKHHFYLVLSKKHQNTLMLRKEPFLRFKMNSRLRYEKYRSNSSKSISKKQKSRQYSPHAAHKSRHGYINRLPLLLCHPFYTHFYIQNS